MKTSNDSRRPKQISDDVEARYYPYSREVETANASSNFGPATIFRKSGWFEQRNLTLQHATTLIQEADAAGCEATLRATRTKDQIRSATPNIYTLRARPRPGPRLIANRANFPDPVFFDWLSPESPRSPQAHWGAGWYGREGATSADDSSPSHPFGWEAQIATMLRHSDTSQVPTVAQD